MTFDSLSNISWEFGAAGAHWPEGGAKDPEVAGAVTMLVAMAAGVGVAAVTAAVAVVGKMGAGMGAADATPPVQIVQTVQTVIQTIILSLCPSFSPSPLTLPSTAIPSPF